MRDQELFFEVREVQREGDDEMRWVVSAGTRDGIPGGRRVVTGDVLMYLPASAAGQSRLRGWMAFPERAEIEFDGGLNRPAFPGGSKP